MKLLNIGTEEEFDAEIVEVESTEYQKIRKEKQFDFDWSKEKSNYVFKIVSKDEEDAQILGLISLIDIPKELRIHINLVEVSKENIGKSKKIARIAGCLIAFATQISFEKGYSGFTSLVPKTLLIKLYVEKYGFSQYGTQLAIEGKASINLIQKYL